MVNIEVKSREDMVLQIFGQIFNKDVSELSKDTRLEEDLHAKSLNIIGLVAMIEAELGTGPTFSSAMRMKRIGEFINFLE